MGRHYLYYFFLFIQCRYPPFFQKKKEKEQKPCNLDRPFWELTESNGILIFNSMPCYQGVMFRMLKMFVYNSMTNTNNLHIFPSHFKYSPNQSITDIQNKQTTVLKPFPSDRWFYWFYSKNYICQEPQLFQIFVNLSFKIYRVVKLLYWVKLYRDLLHTPGRINVSLWH